MPITEVVDGVINLIKQNIIAKTNVTANVIAGDTTVSVENSYKFNDNEEIIFVDWGYNDPTSPHYQVYEYSKIKKINNTHSLTLTSAVESSWLTSNQAFIQKTIGHSPLYENNIYYGDREVIPSDDMAIAVEPESLSNEWIYIQGGLSEEYRLKIMIYGKTIETEDGRRILDRYSDAVYSLLIDHIHLPVGSYYTPIISDVNSGDSVIIIEDNADNRENIVLSSTLEDEDSYTLQDNTHAACGYYKVTNITYGGGIMRVTISPAVGSNFLMSEFGIFRKIGTYIYDSRADNASYGVVSKGSAFLRASEISWWGKRVNDISFPQIMKGGDNFVEKEENTSSSSSSE